MGERFDCAAMGDCMANRGIAGERLDIVDRAAIGTARQRRLHAAVLISERDFQVIDGFALALEAEMARLDDARMDRSDGHFVDFRAVHLEEIGQAADRRRGGSNGRGAGAAAARKADRLQPGVAGRQDAMLFPDFAFEPVGLRAERRERRILRLDRGGQHAQHRLGILGHGRHQAERPVAPRLCEQRGNPPALHNGVEHLAAETFHVEVSPVSGGEGLAIMDGDAGGLRHYSAPTASAARWRKSLSGCGT